MSGELVIPPIVGRMTATAASLAKVLDVLPLATSEDEARAAELLRAIATVAGEGEKERKALKAPHLKAGKAVDAAFREPAKELKRVDGLLRRRLAEAAEEREAARARALRDAQVACQARDHEAVNEALARADTEPARALRGIGTRWTYEAIAFELGDMPTEFLAVDMAAIRREISIADREGREPKIPGVEFKKIAKIIARKL